MNTSNHKTLINEGAGKIYHLRKDIIPEHLHVSWPFLDQTLCEHSGALVRRAAK